MLQMSNLNTIRVSGKDQGQVSFPSMVYITDFYTGLGRKMTITIILFAQFSHVYQSKKAK